MNTLNVKLEAYDQHYRNYIGWCFFKFSDWEFYIFLTFQDSTKSPKKTPPGSAKGSSKGSSKGSARKPSSPKSGTITPKSPVGKRGGTGRGTPQKGTEQIALCR